ncbi:MAG: hypothetical protein ACYC4S_08960 [Rhodoferax sp.]
MHLSKETPASGSNHTTGVNTQNTAAIVNDLAASINTPATDYVRDLAKAGAARLLTKASIFASLHAPHTLWTRRMGTGAAALLVRLEWPGVLCVYDPRTGDKLATSAPGQPETLQ